MFRILHRKQRLWRLLNKTNNESGAESQSGSEDLLSTELSLNLASVSTRLGNSPDVIIREFGIGFKKEIRAAIVFIDGLVDTTQIDRDILTPLMMNSSEIENKVLDPNLLLFIQTKLLPIGDVKTKTTVSHLVESVLSGDTTILIDGIAETLILSTREWEKRAIAEPPSEVIVRGPREGFTETLRTNTSILRRKIRNPNLTFECMRLGRQTKTDVCMVYLKGITNQSLVEEVKRRLKDIHTDSILESGYIEEFIEDTPFSPFETVDYTERPDAIAGRVLEGRVAIIVNGTPMVLTVPALFLEFFQSPEDYYLRSYYSTLVRLIRYAAFAFSLLSPAIYVALVTFHQELLPTPLLISIAAAKEGVPFPSVVEAIGMGLVFEILREAGIRQPRPIGQAVSIVGALVIGQAAVSAGFVGAPMVIVVALTAIASFVTPKLSDLTALLRIVLTVMAGFLGAFGIMIGLLVILIHLASLRSFGIPYLAPIAPIYIQDLKDIVVRVPWWAMFKRPRSIVFQDLQRQEFRLMPNPQKSDQEDRREN
jgi:spore germination protein KA